MRTSFRKGDEAWVVVDDDGREAALFDPLIEWSRKGKHHHLAVSNPKFELFLLLHFENGKGCTTSKAVDAKLKRHMPDYGKRIKSNHFDRKAIEAAIERSRAKRIGDAGLPSPGSTDAHELAMKLLEASDA